MSSHKEKFYTMHTAAGFCHMLISGDSVFVLSRVFVTIYVNIKLKVSRLSDRYDHR